MDRELAAGGLVYNRKTKKFLLIEDPHGVWTLPKGRIEEGEGVEETAVREVAEETGIPLKKLKVLKKLGAAKYVYSFRGRRTFKIVVFYLMETDAARLRPQWEINDAKWFGRNDLLRTAGYPSTREILRKALRSI